jgi:ATP-binding cassette subfamily F protein 3
MSPYDHMLALMPEATEAQRRAKLGALGFGADLADSAAKKLSGGEKARLLLALATFHRPHLLILDEPTNHLDVDAREALIRALGEYEGAVILISHDRHLIEASVDRLWIARGGTAAPYEGDLASYQAECLAEAGEARGAGARKANGQRQISDPKEARRAAAERRAALAPLKKRMVEAERDLERITAEIKAIDQRLGDERLYAQGAEKAQKLATERGRLGRALAEAEDAWLAASEAYETALDGIDAPSPS